MTTTVQDFVEWLGEMTDAMDGIGERENTMPETSFENAFDGREPETCAFCGEIIEDDDYETVEMHNRGEVHVHSADCGYENGYNVCDECGEWFNSDFGVYIEYDSSDFCSTTCAEDNGYRRCSNCGDWAYEDDMYYIENEGEWWCEYCVDNDAYYCEECGSYVTYYAWDDDAECCDRCLENGGGRYGGALHDYNYSDRIEFVKRGDDRDGAIPHIGVELETEKGNNLREYVGKLHELFGRNTEKYYMSTDSSLTGNSAEIVSHPFTLGYHIADGTWERMMQIAKDYGYSSDCPKHGGCGTHFSIDSAFFGKNPTVRAAGGYKLLRIMQRFEPMWKALSRREYFGYCRFDTSYNYDPKHWEEEMAVHPDLKNYGNLQKAKYAARHEYRHELVVNMSHSERFEIRLFAGTLDMDTFIADMAFCEGLAIVAKHHSIEWCEKVKFFDLIAEIVDSVSEPKAAELLLDNLTKLEIL